MDIAMETSESSSNSKCSRDKDGNIPDSTSLNGQQLLVPEVSLEEENKIRESIEQIAKGKERMVDVNDALVSDEAQELEYDVPSIGKAFDSSEQAYDFYNWYAGKIGFRVRKGRSEKTRKGIVRQRTFECSKEGHRKVDNRTRNVRKSRPNTRTGCKARMVVKLTKDGIWLVTEVVREHNHPLAVESKAFLPRPERVVKPTQDAKVARFDNSGISPVERHNSLCEEVRGHGNDLTKFVYRNQLRIQRMRDLKDGDIQVLLDYLENKNLEDPMFFHSVQVDQEDKMMNFFWVDARSVQNYVCFGDVVYFNATNLTNKYGRPFAPFVGVNHHRQNVFFGAALLLDETTESFIWLFHTFLKAMSGQAPKTIVTDQHAAIVKAIAIVMPKTCHRFCLWHIYLDAARNLSVAYTDSFSKRFKNVIYGPETEEDFFSAWSGLLKEFNLEGNKWLEYLFEIREKWALVYGRESFCADMTTIQQSESTDSFLKRYLKRKYNLWRFLKRYEKAMERQRLAELTEDFNSNQTFPTLWADVAMLKEAAKEYTRSMYSMFEEEYKRWIACDCDIFEEVGLTCVYKVTEETKSGERLVLFDSSNSTVVCSCKKFEFMGIQCRHVVKVLNERKIRTLPPQYILKRWTKCAKFGILNNSDGVVIQDSGKTIACSRYSEMCRQSVCLAIQAANSEKATLIVKKILRELHVKVEEILREEVRPKPKTSALFHGDPMSQRVSGIQEKDDGGPSGRTISFCGE
ncbi:protein FAR1-RELATED SEQUENCE 5-like [Macadamia integrifolia]|uniref:protein FAR1-RELATED SEQUENCE 5-like n=1 Tax=Macadamia integrifolia TaxID=60698 RepID=UPI001C4F6772|nr:protein FAR1-RELATED SEQUENCE 5-like [Macadamia integrifolia]